MKPSTSVNTTTVRIRDKDFIVVAKSRNLRCIVEYSRKHKPVRVDLYENRDGSGQLGVVWENDATCITGFADFKTMQVWVKARRFFKGAYIHTNTTNNPPAPAGAETTGNKS